MQGLLNFASSFFVSKAFRFLLGRFDALAPNSTLTTGANLKKLCRVAVVLLKSLPQRSFDAPSTREPLILFTDGAWEEGKASVGGVIFDPRSGWGEVFEIEVPEAPCPFLDSFGGVQIICQIELFAFLASRWKYRSMFRNRLGVAWIDNEAARYTAIKGSSESPSVTALA